MMKPGYRVEKDDNMNDSLRIITPEVILASSMDIYFNNRSDKEKSWRWIKFMQEGKIYG